MNPAGSEYKPVDEGISQHTMQRVIITGASHNHARSLFQFLRTVPSHQTVYVWDFGLNDETRATLTTLFPNIRLRVFDWSRYPAFFDINVAAGEYAWKPAAIWETTRELRQRGEGDLLLWCDAGNMIREPLDPVWDTIHAQGVYSPISAGTVRKWTHPGMLDYMQISHRDPVLDAQPRNGAIIGFDLTNPSARAVLREWASLARCRDCIAPPGSSRENHRQDQALLTLLYYRFTGNQTLQIGNMGIQTHCDCD
jgi:hypothetical protein